MNAKIPHIFRFGVLTKYKMSIKAEKAEGLTFLFRACYFKTFNPTFVLVG